VRPPARRSKAAGLCAACHGSAGSAAAGMPVSLRLLVSTLALNPPLPRCLQMGGHEPVPLVATSPRWEVWLVAGMPGHCHRHPWCHAAPPARIGEGECIGCHTGCLYFCEVLLYFGGVVIFFFNLKSLGI